MIFRLQLIATVMLITLSLLFLTIGVALNQHHNPADMLMTAPLNCEGVCLLGIRPGQSTVLETMLHLRNHQWVSDVSQNAPGNGFAQINWGWSGKQPEAIDESRRGRITFYWNDEDASGLSLNDMIIETVTIYTRVRMYTFQQWFGETTIGNVNNRLDGTLGYIVYYDARGGIISLTTELICPVSIISYWNATTRLTVSIGNSGDAYIRPSEMIRLC